MHAEFTTQFHTNHTLAITLAIAIAITPARQTRIPMTLAKQYPNPPQYSYCSSTSSARTSELSGAYILTRTNDVPRSCSADSAARSGQARAQVKTAKDASLHSQSDGRRRDGKMERIATQESWTPNIAYFPPPPSASSLSANTYDSRYSADRLGCDLVNGNENCLPDRDDAQGQHLLTAEDCAVPDVLGPYCCAKHTDPPLRPSDPRTFRYLFPSWDCLTIRHDDMTADGNMNLRVDTVALGLGSSRERDGPVTVQLFHLRMHNLVERQFSLRRYCRDSGREVCFSKRAYTSASRISRNGFQQSVSSALRSVRAPFHRSNVLDASCFSLKPSSLPARRRPSMASTTSTTCSSLRGGTTDGSSDGRPAARRADVKSSPSLLLPTDKVKLEFGNYARVEVSRRGSKCYVFEWWGHKYAWKRALNKHLDTFSFHLRRVNRRDVLAHIEQERQSPGQKEAEKRAGGWVPRCYMWFEWSVITGPRDVAEIFMATGLMALVDDCIRQEWQCAKGKRPVPAPPGSPGSGSGQAPTLSAAGSSASPRRGLFCRRRRQASHGPFRLGKAVSVY